eukprot:14149059-Ditylum_brightwellii.AAC.2
MLAVQTYVSDRWEAGHPCTQPEVYDMLRSQDECAEGIEFYRKKNSIGQKVPENWKQLVEEDSKRGQRDTG